jgi:hypothetical protein
MQCPTQEFDIRTDTSVEWSKAGVYSLTPAV